MQCRGCQSQLPEPFLDLGFHPLSNAFLKSLDDARIESSYPLVVHVCTECWLVQVPELASREEVFTDDYVYFSSYSSSWVKHAEGFSKEAIEKLNLDTSSRVVEIASNDGYLLQHFQRFGAKVLGVEPCLSVAKAARSIQIPTITEFFGKTCAEKISRDFGQADLICANNVLAHVPSLDDFLMGFKILLKSSGTITFEFPHLLKLLQGKQFDTVYQEHYSYLSLTALEPILNRIGLRTYDVEQLPTHGGSLRLWVSHVGNENRLPNESVGRVFEEEKRENLTSMSTYVNFAREAARIKEAFLEFLLQAKQNRKKVGAYGAAAKGNTLFNFCRVSSDLVQMVADKNPVKQNRFLPGSHVPVVSPEELLRYQPDYVVILPWNLRAEVAAELHRVRAWDGRFVVAVPELEIFS